MLNFFLKKDLVEYKYFFPIKGNKPGKRQLKSTAVPSIFKCWPKDKCLPVDQKLKTDRDRRAIKREEHSRKVTEELDLNDVGLEEVVYTTSTNEGFYSHNDIDRDNIL